MQEGVAQIPLQQVKALVFDVFGTLVDWHSSIAREAEIVLAQLGVALDWLAFADAWQRRYQPALEEVRSGRMPFAKLDHLHRRNLDLVLAEFAIDQVDEAARRRLNLAWRRLDAWPDVGPGLAALRTNYLLAPCSNGSIAQMVALARRNGFVWDAILGAEVARDYKPKPVVYLDAAAAFDLEPAQTMMVAAHSADLSAAAAAGLRTAFLARPDEFGCGKGEAQPQLPVDISVSSLLELARTLARRV